MARVDIHGNPIVTEDGIVGSVGDRKDSGKFAYYRLGANGYITAGPAWATERERREEKGDQVLRRYGTFMEIPHTANRYAKILRAGGAKEFPLSQIIELGWHRKPPLDGVTFPQLDGVTVIDHKCGYCGKALLGCRVNEDGELVEDDTNRRRHEAIAHKEIASQEQLGRTLATALAQMQPGGQSTAALEMFAKLVGDMQERQKAQDKLIQELTDKLAGGVLPIASVSPAVESGPQTMTGKKGKKGKS